MGTSSIRDQLERCTLWPERLAPEQWGIYKSVISEARRRNFTFAVGGGLAAMLYAGQWRNTKDIDLYVPGSERESMISLVGELGLKDYYEVSPYDRKWIYRSHKDDTIVDIIWAMANQRAVVDESWFRGPLVEVEGECFQVLAPEEELWSKLYVMQRDRCDWPDALNLIYGAGLEMDWRHVLDKVGPDRPLLLALLSVFGWVCPERANELPAWLWDELRAKPGLDSAIDSSHKHARLLDSRPWFTPALEPPGES